MPSMVKKVHSEIFYDVLGGVSIHSDTCPPQCDFNNMTEKHRKYLHDLLDEWLNKSNGTGAFYIKAEDFDLAKEMIHYE